MPFLKFLKYMYSIYQNEHYSSCISQLLRFRLTPMPLTHSPLTHGSVLINRISSKNQQSLAYCQFFLRYQKIKCDGSNLDSFTWGFGWFSSFIYCRTPCCHCDTVKTSNFSQIQPNLAKIWQNRETSAYYKKISYRPKMKCK